MKVILGVRPKCLIAFSTRFPCLCWDMTMGECIYQYPERPGLSTPPRAFQLPAPLQARIQTHLHLQE